MTEDIGNLEIRITDTYNVFQGKVRKSYHMKIYNKLTDEYVYNDDEVGGQFFDVTTKVLRTALDKLAQHNISLEN